MLSEDQIKTLTRLDQEQRKRMMERMKKEGRYKEAFEIMKFDCELKDAQDKASATPETTYQWLSDHGAKEIK